MNRTGSISSLAAAAALASAAAAQQTDVLLVVDLSVENQITITATDGLSAATAVGSDSIGVYFDNFYGVSGSSLSATLLFGDLTSVGSPTDGSPSLFRGGIGSDTGLNMYSWSDDLEVTFTAGERAFIGSATWALDANEYLEMLAASLGGNLYFPADTADDVSGATLLGRYTVIIPAPGAVTLAGAGLAMTALRRRR